MQSILFSNLIRSSSCVLRTASTIPSQRFLSRSSASPFFLRSPLDPLQPPSTPLPLSHSRFSSSHHGVAPEDAKLALSSLSNWALWRAWIVFKACSIGPFVQNAQTLLDLSFRVFGRTLTLAVIHRTFFAHFCAGETADEVEVSMKKLRSMGVGSILDYAAEADIKKQAQEDPDAVYREQERVGVVSARTYDYLGEEKCDANVQIFLDCIDAAARQPNGFTAIKLTALGKPEFLRHISEILQAIRRTFHDFATGGSETISFEQFRGGLNDRLGLSLTDEELRKLFTRFDIDGNGHIDYLEWTSVLDLDNLDHSKLFFADAHDEHGSLSLLTKHGKIPLIGEDEAQLIKNLTSRLQIIAKTAAERKVMLLIDAEQSYLQPAIEHFTRNLQRAYNKQQPIVFNTYQAYLTKSNTDVAADLLRSKREGFWFAAKLVRGAYMVMERQLAADGNYPSPILPNKQATDDNYDRLADAILKHTDHASVMIATHNQHSIQLATELMNVYGIPPSGNIHFAQLLGMSDVLTYSLGAKGYNVYKYVPYGPVHEVIPYLLRRAQENSDVMSFAQYERELCWKELVARKFFF